MSLPNDHPHVTDSIRLLRSAALHLLNIRFGPLADNFLAAFNSGRATVEVYFTLPDFNKCQFRLTWPDEGLVNALVADLPLSGTQATEQHAAPHAHRTPCQASARDGLQRTSGENTRRRSRKDGRVPH